MAFPFLSIVLLFTPSILLPSSSIAQRHSNVTSGSFLTADNTNSSWISSSGEFAFGFQRIVPEGGYLLSIWFDKITEKTIVWSANRDSPSEEGSRIQLFADGRFELHGPRGDLIWNVARRGGVAYAAMLDSGNFVLALNTGDIVWQSFDHPTDTLLPTQILERGSSLVSTYSETNFSTGRFVFRENDGTLALQSKNFPMDNNVYQYWKTGNTDPGYKLVFNQSGYIFLAANNGSILEELSNSGVSADRTYQRAILEYDGVFRHYVYPKFADSTDGRMMKWSILDFFPQNICTLFNGAMSWGACGFNSFCSAGDDEERPICSCPDGYSPTDSNIRMSGCKPNFFMHNCDRQSEESQLFRFHEILNTDFTGGDYMGYRSMEEDQCRRACLDDCFCAAVVYEGRNCWKKRFPLANGRKSPSFSGKILIKIRKDNTTQVASSGGKPSTIDPYSNLPGVHLRSFSFGELQEATNGFKEELGSGACSTVYKGAVKDESDDKVIAVKKLNKISAEAEKEFKAEVSSISRTNHKNLVKLLGYCEEGQNRLLVYEFMTNGSLASFLFQKPKPSWYSRVQIALATAKGLCYLHQECSTQIIHCDIKPQNILLDESLTAKISDFGLAKLLRTDQTKTTTAIRGTRGYVAPEWYRNMPITSKVDVYSFGILLLEIVCCRRKVERHGEHDESVVILVEWAYDCYASGRLKSLVDDDDDDDDVIRDIERFEKFVMIGIWCVQDDPSLRPNMKRVLHMLEGAIQVPNPPHPESFIT
ncbi:BRASSINOSTEROID INSENSITIVE 1-associated receptor kinase 1 precursor [Dorcoceras hygrometricum]|uniref:Receptor-like serine/threonine-protein kinase n=1 Tax=Dorcoceras hygrometricum TaxID=472368 RepID=A0A2Z7CBJ8_9LAMI|nr:BRASSINOSTEROID INSENSITIVE 1-associated receptor kinase 1 precursor [Dorcoceras hygrometricum]